MVSFNCQYLWKYRSDLIFVSTLTPPHPRPPLQNGLACRLGCNLTAHWNVSIGRPFLFHNEARRLYSHHPPPSLTPHTAVQGLLPPSPTVQPLLIAMKGHVGMYTFLPKTYDPDQYEGTISDDVITFIVQVSSANSTPSYIELVCYSIGFLQCYEFCLTISLATIVQLFYKCPLHV